MSKKKNEDEDYHDDEEEYISEIEEDDIKEDEEDYSSLTIEEEKELENILSIRKERKQLLKKIREEQEKENSSLSDEQKKLNRFQNLLQQTEIFSINLSKLKEEEEEDEEEKSKDGPKRKSEHRLTEKEEDEEILKETLVDEDHSSFSRLTTSPSYIENTKLRNYQLHGLNWLIKMYDNAMNGILADEMGLGKTLQTISFLGYLKHFRENTMPNIVIVPKSVIANWVNECHKWCPSLRVLKFHGNQEERKVLKDLSLIKGNFDVCITSFEMAIIEKQALKKFKWKYLIIDEAHRIKNEKSVLSKCVRIFDAKFRLLLTGTPLQNNLHELWALLNFLLPEVFTSSEEFDSWFNLKEGQAEKEIMDHLHKLLKPFMLRRLKSDVEKEIPPKKEILVECGLSVLQKEWYKSILTKDSQNILAIKGREKVKLLNVVMQLRKVCNHPYLFDGAEPGPPFTTGEHLSNNSGKMAMLDRLLEKLLSQGSRVLIFSQMTRMLDILEDFCFLRQYGYCRIDGQTSSHDRESYIEEFNKKDSKKFIFLLSTRAGGLGINLATADTVILYDSDWNPQADLQAQDRAHRIGQTKPVNVYRLITKGTIEEKIYQRAVKKLYLDAVVIQQGRLVEQNQSLSKSELLAMITFGAEEVFKTSDQSSISDEQLESILSRGEKKVQEIDKNMKETFQTNLLNFSLLEDSNLYEFEGLDYSQKPTTCLVIESLPKDMDETTIRKLCKEQEQNIEEVIMSNHKNSLIIYFRHKTGASKALEYLNSNSLKTKFCKKNDFLTKQIESNLVEKEPLKSSRRKGNYVFEEKKPQYNGPKEPKYSDYQFVNEKRLLEIWEKEKEFYLKTKEEGQVEESSQGITDEEQKEKEQILSEGFLNWTKKNFLSFLSGLEKYGRDGIDKIVIEGKSKEDIKKYSDVFFKKMKQLNDYDKISKRISRGEATIERMKTINKMIQWKTQKYENPWNELTINYGQSHELQFNSDEDAFLICFTAKLGYGNFEEIKNEFRKSWEFRFDFFIKSRTAIELQKRCDHLIKLIEKEYNDETGNLESKKRKLDLKNKKKKKKVKKDEEDEEDDE